MGEEWEAPPEWHQRAPDGGAILFLLRTVLRFPGLYFQQFAIPHVMD